MDIGNRIKQRRIALNISADELAEMVGKSRATIYRYENGDIENLPTTILEPLAVALSTTPAYLMGWDDDPYDYDKYDLEIPSHFNGDVKKFFEFEEAVKQDNLKEHLEFDTFLTTVTPSERGKIEKYRDLDTHGKKMVDFTLNEEWERSTSTHEKEIASNIPNTPTRFINYYYRLASAGTGQIMFDMPPTKHIEIPDLPEYRKADYAIGVNGNSMEPTYYDGDTLLVEMTEKIEIGEIGIFSVNNECYVKKLERDKLISLNPEYENIALNETAHCMGRVLGKLKND